MKYSDFETFWENNKKYLVITLMSQKKYIDDDMRDYPEDLPYMTITISVNKECTDCAMQTGDNSYTGACYGHPYWGVGTLHRRSNCKKLADDLISDLAEQIDFEKE